MKIWPKCLIQEPFSIYLEKGKDYLRSGPLATFRHSPYEYKAERDGIRVKEDTGPLSFGRALHSLVLEGEDVMWKDYVAIPDELKKVNKNTKDYQSWKKSQTKCILSDDEIKILRYMKDNIFAHEGARGLLTGGIVECTVRAEYCGEQCQARIDNYNGNLIDLKSCRNLDFFEKDARFYEYAHQLSFYREIFMAADDNDLGIDPRMVPKPDCHIIAVEKRAPYRVGAWKIKDDFMAWAQSKNEKAIKELKECREFDHWPSRFEAVRELGFYIPMEG